MDLGRVAQVALGQADQGVRGLADPGRTGHRASTALAPKKACDRVPVRMPRVRRWDRDLRDRPWPKERLVPKVIVRRNLTVDQTQTVDRGLIADLGKIGDHDLIADLGKIEDRDLKALLLVIGDRDLKALATVDQTRTVVRDLIADLGKIVARVPTVDLGKIVARDLHKEDLQKVAPPFRRPNLQRRHKQRSRSSSFRRPNPWRLQSRGS